jgi:hypothetical protein
MSSELDHLAKHQARLDRIMDEFRTARQRRLVKQGIALWNRTEEAYRQAAAQGAPPPPKLN